jgi:phosphatidylserine synthase
VISYLMVSEINYPSLKQLKLERRRQFDVLPLIGVSAAIVYLLKNYVPAIVFFGFTGYILWGIGGRAVSLTKRRVADRQDTSQPSKPV